MQVTISNAHILQRPIGAIIITSMRYVRDLRSLKFFLTGVISTFAVFGLGSAAASSANISHSYLATGSIPNGSIVSLDPHRSGYVQLANVDNGSRLLGVALASQDSLLAVDPGSGTVQVATSGNVNTLVSTVNGAIKVGDQVGVSPFGGIGMKATSGGHIVGIAQTAFSSSSAEATTQSVKNKNGQSRQIELGYIRLSIAVGTAGNGGSGGGPQLNFLQKLSKSLTGHTISIIRILLSIVVTIISIISLITLIYASVYGSIVSIGRNPLAQHAVFRTLTSVMIMAVLTIAIACVTIFYLLH
jgi:hypothetical protein